MTGTGPPTTAARWGLMHTERQVAWPELMPPGRALAALRAELDARGLATASMTITRLQGILTLAGGPAIGYRYGWLFWPAGRLSRGGPPGRQPRR